VGAPELQCAIGDPKTARGALKVPVFFLSDATNRDLFGCAADLLQSRAEEHSAFDRTFEMQI
jgi:hypothetical protein